MEYSDLRHFLAVLEAEGDLVRVAEPVSTRLEMTAVSDFTLRQGGPALLFEKPAGYTIPVLANLFGTTVRVAKAMGATEVSGLRDIGVAAGQPQGAGAAQGTARRRPAVTNGQDAVDMRPVRRARPRLSRGRDPGRQRDRSRPAAGPDVLARRRGPADHLGPGRHARAAGRAERAAPEPRHLPPAGDRRATR